ncbi:carbohydrate porin [Povalibacter sp.]|uniref:carbohydrate porin n=1 Tax=Povalibacter sp. TaxID=1962978 RepID=UPI002F3F39EE
MAGTSRQAAFDAISGGAWNPSLERRRERRCQRCERSAQLDIIVRQPFSANANEVLGLAITSARTGQPYRRGQQSLGMPIDKAERSWHSPTGALSSWLTLQPDLQWIVSPGASRELRNALVVGLPVEVSAEWSR